MRLVRCFCLSLTVSLVAFSHANDPLRYEAEDAALTGTAINSSAGGYSGSGYVAGFTDEADRSSFSFVATEGVYSLVIGYRTPSGEKGFNGELNGVGFSGMFEASSVWRRFEVGSVLLEEGENTLWIGGGWSYYEIDYIELLEVEPPAPPLPVDPTPVDSLASEEVKSLLVYLSEHYGKLTFSGQQDVAELDIVESLTGVRPAIIGGDLIEYSPTRIANGSNPNNHTESLIAQHDAGMIVTLSWHWNAPTDLLLTEENPWWSGFYSRATTFNFAAALDDPEGANYQLLLRDIDVIAVELKKLQEAKVPVLWRPLHESDGGWFWWGTQGADNLRRLWVLLYDRLTDYHGIHNLIWVQTIENLEWYAGDEYVDLLGVDAYPEDPRDPQTSIWKRFIDRFDGEKMISLSEFGRVPDVPTMHRLGVWFSYFMSWSGDLGAAGMPDQAELIRIYTSSGVVTFDELVSPDLDEDGLSALLEDRFGSSDEDSDSNDDGVLDGLSVKIGYTPFEDLSAMLAFFEASEKRIELRSGSGDLKAQVSLALESVASDIELLKLRILGSSDLENWSEIDFLPSAFKGSEGSSSLSIQLTDGERAFVRFIAEQR
ncbi:Glycosyl hydrolase family 26 [Verrucomicrobiia bacterium DG1235]|nr:Glycosyl hydrolase family 26 [Verrucomicrobiae bacterium DG1235]